MTRLILASAAFAIAGSTAWLSATAPYRATLGAYTTDLAGRTREQRINIAEASRRLDGAEIEPGETLSFNAQVGPRTEPRGFVAAPAYLEGMRHPSVGGGICQLSSTAYNAALVAGLPIRQRVAHDRLVRSVAPGADATVWYGKADLAIGNDSGDPVRIRSVVTGDRLTVTIQGRPGRLPGKIVRERVLPLRPETVRIQTWRLAGDRRVLVADDTYRYP
jgi:vancomycin resistance protein YoaR